MGVSVGRVSIIVVIMMFMRVVICSTCVILAVVDRMLLIVAGLFPCMFVIAPVVRYMVCVLIRMIMAWAAVLM